MSQEQVKNIIYEVQCPQCDRTLKASSRHKAYVCPSCAKIIKIRLMRKYILKIEDEKQTKVQPQAQEAVVCAEEKLDISLEATAAEVISAPLVEEVVQEKTEVLAVEGSKAEKLEIPFGFEDVEEAEVETEAVVEEVEDESIQSIKPRKSRLRMPHETLLAQIIIITIVAGCTLFSFMPLFLTLVNSFKTVGQVKSNVFAFPELTTLFGAAKDNFSSAWGEIGTHYFSTILVAFIGAVVKVLISATLAYILTFKNFYFKDFIFMVFIAILLVPSIIGYPILVPLVRDKFGLGNTHLGYLLPIVGGGQVMGMFLLKTFFGQQPKSLYESAQLDGANDVAMFTRITIPLALPIILYNFVESFSGIYNEYLWASLILDGDKLTLTHKMYTLVADGTMKYGAMYAMYMISSVPLIITTIISMKYFKSGEFAAGLKL